MPLPPETVAALVDNHQRFRDFLTARLDNEADAEEILQTVFARTLERGDTLDDQSRAVAWFFRALRNAIIDHYRHQAARHRSLERLGIELEAVAPPPEVEAALCACFRILIPTLHREYGEILTRVELGGEPLRQYAAAAGITAGNARVRLHRARRALHKMLAVSCGTCTAHGCLDCTCTPAA